jgi:hypothetical protein
MWYVIHDGELMQALPHAQLALVSIPLKHASALYAWIARDAMLLASLSRRLACLLLPFISPFPPARPATLDVTALVIQLCAAVVACFVQRLFKAIPARLATNFLHAALPLNGFVACLALHPFRTLCIPLIRPINKARPRVLKPSFELLFASIHGRKIARLAAVFA